MSSSRGETRAVIDVGTNSVKLLIAEVQDSVVWPLHESGEQTRLGQGFYETHILQTAAIDQTAKAVAGFVQVARSFSAAVLRVVATSAARDAKNSADLIRALEGASGVPLEIISGEQEADWAFKGVTTDPQLASGALLVMDVGGGSSEFIHGAAGARVFAESVPLGTVRILESIQISDPPSDGERHACELEVRRVLQSGLQRDIDLELRKISVPIQLVGTGGTSTIMARIKGQIRSFDRELIEGTVLTREELSDEIGRLWSMPLEKRKQVTGLPPNRADVILPGSVIFHQVMELFGLDRLRVSTRGLRFAALLDVTQRGRTQS